jgi:hypothetical protein
MKYFIAAILLMSANVPAPAKSLFTYVGTKIDNSGCSGNCHFTHVKFTVVVDQKLKPNDSITFCAGMSCPSPVGVTFTDGESTLTLRNIGEYFFEGQINLDSYGTGVASATISAGQSHEKHPHIIWYAQMAQTDGDFFGGQIGNTGFNVGSSGPGTWRIK